MTLVTRFKAPRGLRSDVRRFSLTVILAASCSKSASGRFAAFAVGLDSVMEYFALAVSSTGHTTTWDYAKALGGFND